MAATNRRSTYMQRIAYFQQDESFTLGFTSQGKFEGIYRGADKSLARTT